MAQKGKEPAKAADPAGTVGAGEFRSSSNVRTGLILGATFGIKAVQYSVIEEQAIFEGDIVLGTVDQVSGQTDVLRQAGGGEVAMGVVRTGAQFRWANCQIPYDIDPALPSQNRVTDAIAHWEANTRYRFILRNAGNAAQHPDWVTFRPSSGCSSSVGRQGGQQFVNLGSGCSTGNTIHEIGHVIGLWHEQSREDRDTFITIHWDKIQAGLEHNFNQHITDGDDVGAYDYGSIMHYPRNAFSVDGSDTITPVDAAAQIGQRAALSAGDIAAANSLCPLKILKEGVKDVRKDVPWDTRKEMVKDVRLDTRKELVADTRKEMLKDRVKEVAKDAIKDAALDPGVLKGAGDVINPGLGVVVQPGVLQPGIVQPGVVRPGGAVPFAVTTVHQAPAAGTEGGGGTADVVTQLDIRLQTIAEALTQAEVNCQSLQQQYDETAALLRKALDEHDQASS
ncbi:MAG: M12 family metallopeptidase [Acidobacteria bacterium]|nr:M12 family metallopeptidase [Acidobacteriota bacterium]